jgi:hypothetical protein
VLDALRVADLRIGDDHHPEMGVEGAVSSHTRLSEPPPQRARPERLCGITDIDGSVQPRCRPPGWGRSCPQYSC